MTDTMLHGVLRMPIDLWRDEEIDKEQRHQRYLQASDRIYADEREIARLRETLQGIVEADWRKWEELASPDEFVRWARSRANHALQSDPSPPA